MSDPELPTIDDIRAAAARVAPHLHRTPMIGSETLSRRCGLDLLLKCESLQKTGSFKPRGAISAAIPASPNSLTKPNTLRYKGSVHSSRRESK